MKINKRKRNDKHSRSGRIPKGSYGSKSCSSWDEDALILSDELDLDMASEFPGLKVEDSDVQTGEEEEVVEYIPRTFGKAADPIRIYLNDSRHIVRSNSNSTGLVWRPKSLSYVRIAEESLRWTSLI